MEVPTLLNEVFKDLNGNSQKLSDLLNHKSAIVNLWATWCGPCIAELPLLIKFQKNNPNWQVIYINQGESAEKIKNFLQKRQFMLAPALLDTQGVSAKYINIEGFPTSVIYDEKGKQVKIHKGVFTKQDLDKLVKN